MLVLSISYVKKIAIKVIGEVVIERRRVSKRLLVETSVLKN